MSIVISDLRSASRALLRSPGLALLVTMALGLGIGATTVVASLVNAVMLRTHDYMRSERLVRVSLTDPLAGRRSLSIPDYLDFQARAKAFEWLAALVWGQETLSESGPQASPPDRVAVTYVTANLFPSLGVQPRLGRTLTPADETIGATPVAVLSHGYWQSRFAGRREILGHTIRLSGDPYVIIGVMPEGFLFPPSGQPGSGEPAAVWTPLLARRVDPGWNTRDRRVLNVWGHLRADVTKTQARADVARVADELAEEQPATNRGVGASVWTFDEYWVPPSRRAVTVLLGAVAVLLLIACANVANLLLAKALSRQREMATRVALGASPAHIIRHIMAESLILALTGTAVGLGLATLGLTVVRRLLPPGFDHVGSINLDGTVLVIVVGVTLLTTLVVGTVPAWSAACTDVREALQGGIRQGEGPAPQRLRASLVVSEIALSLLLLVATGLLLRSFMRLEQTDLGFRPENVLTFGIDLPAQKYLDAASIVPFTDQFLERLRALPGVEAVAVTNDLPLHGANVVERRFTLDGYRDDADEPITLLQIVSPEYFETLTISVVAGRAFTASDARATPGVALVDAAFVRRYLPDQNPVGRRLTLGGPTYGGPEDYGSETQFEIIGVLPEVRHWGPDVPQNPRLYVPFHQKPWPQMGFAIRTVEGQAGALTAALRKELQGLDQDQAAFDIQMLETRLRERAAQARWNMVLTGLIGGIALLLTALGTYGMMAHFVTRRRQEIGVRLALGARPGRAALMVLRDAVALTILGVALGLAGAWATSRVMAGLLFEVTPRDPIVLVSATVLLLIVGVVSSAVPAWRAARVDPVEALRVG